MTNRSDPRARLLDAAKVVLDRDGLEGLTLRAIAREAGVSHGAPLRHFTGLAALLTALSTRGFQDLMAELSRVVEADETPTHAEARLTKAGAAYIHFATTNPGVFGLMFRPELLDTSDPDYQKAGAASFDQLVQLVRAAQAEGWHADQPTDQLSAMLWAQVHGVAQLWLHGALQAVVAVERVEDLVDLFTRLSAP